MKNYKILAIAACLVALAACDKEKEFVLPGGLDSSKPGVTSFSYDEATSGNTAAGFTWTADQAIAAGATSFTLELTKDISVSNPNNKSLISIVDAPNTAYIVTKLKKDAFYYARIRANYDGYYFSEWTYLGSASAPLVVRVGTGAAAAEFGTPTGLTLKADEGIISVSWDPTPFAEGYVLEYKPANSGDWMVVDGLTATSYLLESLPAETTFDVRVKAIWGDKVSEYATGTATTPVSKAAEEKKAAEDLVAFIKGDGATNPAAVFTLNSDANMSSVTIPAGITLVGTIDGGGFTLKGFNASAPLVDTLAGTIKNLVFGETCSFRTTGGFIAPVTVNNKGTISKVTNKAAVTVAVATLPDPALVAGIAAISSGEISDCVNEGAISLAASESVVGFGIAGIVGYQTGAVKGCTNRGAVGFSAKNVSSKATLFDTGKNVLPTPGGICAIGAPGFSMENCNNYGSVTYALTGADVDLKANMNRNQIGGIVGAPCGMIMNCNNYGEVNVALKHSTPGTALGYEYIVCVGGIGGGDALFTNTTDKFSNTSYINCVNEGTISVDSDASKSNSAIGGIVGWPGQEKPATGTSVTGCTNKGAVIGNGAMKCRLGGIEGGTGIIENCTNTGTITLETGNVGSAVGSLCAFHSQGHAITGCTAGGEVVCKVATTGGVGGLIANIGNVDHNTCTGCVVNCKITTSSDATTTGMVVGLFNGTSKVITLGAESDPIKVSGSINGAAAAADNVRGTKNTHANHTINFVIK